jgi:hypothetical protein
VPDEDSALTNPDVVNPRIVKYCLPSSKKYLDVVESYNLIVVPALAWLKNVISEQTCADNAVTAAGMLCVYDAQTLIFVYTEPLLLYGSAILVFIFYW